MKTILVDAWNTFVTENGINQDLYEMLETFIEPKIIVTNANEEEKLKFGIVNMPYPVFSLAHNPNKTDASYFNILMDQLNLKTKDILYFEHNEDAVASARSLGITTYHFIAKDPLDNLKAFLNNHI